MTEVYFCFDTEDYTSPKAWDAIVREADLLKKHGVRGNFNVVGYNAREWIRNKRYDVPQALEYHNVGTHSLRHSYHPTLLEYTDLESYDEARRLLLEQECEGIGMVKAVTGRDRLLFACPPGNSLSYVAMYEYVELGIKLYLGSVFAFRDGRSVYFCNGLHTNYDYALEGLFYPGRTFRSNHKDVPYETGAFLDEISRKKRVVLYTHPTRAYHSTFWDLVNYDGENKHPMHEWEPTPLVPPETTERFFAEFDKLVAALKNDKRFVIRDMAYLDEKVTRDNAARVIRFDELGEMKRQLENDFFAVKLPSGTFSLSDCFAAAAHFCNSKEDFYPQRVRGFLSTPLGVTSPVKLTADDVKTLAAAYVPNAFMPTHYRVRGRSVGPADLLFAMIDVALGAEEVTVEPRPQLPTLDRGLNDLGYEMLERLSFKGKTWVNVPDFADNFLSARLKLQSWTLREEE
ncbi:MAG: hypothetical protein IJV00_04390 [Clostridia bacterium]|nr:hypothetical protein [Clostridia bacterium]